MSLVCKELGELVDFKGGGTPSRNIEEYWGNLIPWATVKDLNEGITLTNTQEFITELGLKNSASNLIPKGSIIIPTRMSLGKVVISEIDVAINQDLKAVLVKNNELLDTKYLLWFLASNKENIASMGKGATVKGITLDQLRAIKVPLPPLSEQRRIASILDKADELRQKRQQAIKKLDQLLQVAFVDIFGDPVSNPKGWDKLTIEKILNKDKYSLKRGPFGGALKKEIFVESGYLVYEQYHALNNDFTFQRYFIEEAKYKELKAFDVKPKDIIVSCSGVNLGKLAEVPEGAPAGIINQALLKISLNQGMILNDVFIDIFMHPSFKKAFYGDFRGAAIPNFPPMSVFKEFEFIVPPLETQKKYQKVKSQVKALQKKHQLAEEMNLFTSLQNQAFSGTL